MHTLSCSNPAIVASRLTSIRNIYLRQELRTISNQIQEIFPERLPMLQLISIVAYEQVFNRQPLSSPEELRREAIKYGIKYYQLNMEKLKVFEARSGLHPNIHVDLKSVKSNHDVPPEIQVDKNQFNSTLRSTTNDSTLQSSSIDVKTIATSDESTTDSITSDETLSSPSEQLSTSFKRLPHKESPKIIVHRPSDSCSKPSSNSKKSSTTSDKNQQSKKKQRNASHRSKKNK